LPAVDYQNLMLDRLDEASDERIKTLVEIKKDKLRVDRAYIKKKDSFVGLCSSPGQMPLDQKKDSFVGADGAPDCPGPDKTGPTYACSVY
jgi:hypothetical protein